MTKSLPPFPQEDAAAPWPSLIPTQYERSYKPERTRKRDNPGKSRAQTSRQPAAGMGQSQEQLYSDILYQKTRPLLDQRQLFMLDLRAAVVQGVFLGLLLSGLISTFVLQGAFWLQGWGRLCGAGVLLLLLLLMRFLGLGRGSFIWCILAAFSGFVLMGMQLVRGQTFLLFLALISLVLCIVIRVSAEWLYVPRSP